MRFRRKFISGSTHFITVRWKLDMVVSKNRMHTILFSHREINEKYNEDLQKLMTLKFQMFEQENIIQKYSA